ncbi:MAG: adenylate/guanylate cyclase domain-containing protein [Lentisphaeria bacterium]|jgi:adenylate cyclase|nr:adenylate/guanylate cyclase domain-containing protein [Lentisphaeria bacterium]
MPGTRETDGTSNLAPLWFKSRSIRVTIMVGFAGLLLLTAVPIIAYMHSRNTEALLEFADELMAHVSDAIIEKTSHYLKPAAVMAEMGAHLAEEESFSLTETAWLEPFAIAVLEAHPQLAMFNLADERGNFLMPKKMPDGTIATKIIDREASPPTVTWKYRDRQGNVVRRETTTEVDYDPRVRPWYVGAKEAGGVFWTDMYILFTDQTPGITTSYPLVDRNGRTVGVFGLDIELGAMSRFLKTLKVGKNGVAFIFNEKDEVVAYHEIERLVRQRDGKTVPALVHELGEPRITQCLNTYREQGAPRFPFTSAGEHYIGSVREFPNTLDRGWKIGMVVPQDEFIGKLRKTARDTLLISLAILVGALLVARGLSFSISQPIMVLAEEAHKIQNLRFDDAVDIDSPIKEIQDLQNALASMKVGLSAFGKYVPSALVKQLVHQGQAARIGGQREELTLFFSDIAGFTPISESLAPEDLMVHLSRYLDEMTRVISAHQGTVDKFIGDAVMAFWGAPTPQPDHAYLACLAALHCQRHVRELNAKWAAEGKPIFLTRIGIHTGEVVVGNVGSAERMNYSVFGDAVNLASRLEGASKVYGTSIIVGQDTRDRVADRLVFRPLDRVTVVGRKQGIMVYELLGEAGGELPPGHAELCVGFAQGLDAYFNRDWELALHIFGPLGDTFPDDAPTALFLKRCRNLLAHPPGDDWDGITQLETK